MNLITISPIIAAIAVTCGVYYLFWTIGSSDIRLSSTKSIPDEDNL